MIYLFLLNHLIQEAVDEGIRFQYTSIRYDLWHKSSPFSSNIQINYNYITNLTQVRERKWRSSGWVVCLFCVSARRQRHKAGLLLHWLPKQPSWSHTKPPVICFPGLQSRIDERATNEPDMTNHWFSCSFQNERWEIYAWRACGSNGRESGCLMHHLWLIFQIRSARPFSVIVAFFP